MVGSRAHLQRRIKGPCDAWLEIFKSQGKIKMHFVECVPRFILLTFPTLYSYDLTLVSRESGEREISKIRNAEV